MPLFNRKKEKQSTPVEEAPPASNGQTGTRSQEAEPEPGRQRPKLVFHCQQAHGSPTGVISGFTNVKELYQRIAECYEMQPSDVRFLYQSVIISRLLAPRKPFGRYQFVLSNVPF